LKSFALVRNTLICVWNPSRSGVDNRRPLTGPKPSGATVTFWSFTHFQRVIVQSVYNQLATNDLVRLEVLLNIGKTGWVGLKLNVASGADPHAFPICLESTIGLNVLDDIFNVLGLTAARVGYDFPPPDDFHRLFSYCHYLKLH
jgi:hypothetical protein